MNTTNEASIDELLAVRDVMASEAGEANARLAAAERELLVARFRDMEHYEEGDIVLAPRTLFGEVKMWPFKITKVWLTYEEGVWDVGDYNHPSDYVKSRHGDKWITRRVSYTGRWQAKDGSFTGQSTSMYGPNEHIDGDEHRRSNGEVERYIEES